METKLEYNYVLTVAVLSWCAAQVIKTLIHFIRYRTFHAERLFGAGGMPSSHSALVCSATLGVARMEGLGSPVFAVMFVLAVVVMYDAMGVRRAAGQQAKEINRMKQFLEKNTDMPSGQGKGLKEFLGHTPFEVLGGALLGILLALIVPMR